MEIVWPDVKKLVQKIKDWRVETGTFEDGPYEWVHTHATQNQGVWRLARHVSCGKIKLPSGMIVPGEFPQPIARQVGTAQVSGVHLVVTKWCMHTKLVIVIVKATSLWLAKLLKPMHPEVAAEAQDIARHRVAVIRGCHHLQPLMKMKILNQTTKCPLFTKTLNALPPIRLGHQLSHC